MSTDATQPAIYKYPRTQHIAGSRLQPGDEDLEQVAFADLQGRFVVIEEKVDGANCAVSFSSDYQLLLQSRGHYLRDSGRERQFNRLKTWVSSLEGELLEVLTDRYIMYGEWLYAKHTVFYDRLPHYFLEFDILDRERGLFLSTKARKTLLAGLPVVSVPVLWAGVIEKKQQMTDLIQNSLFKSNLHHERLIELANRQGLDIGRTLRETDSSQLAEGLYIKAEDDEQVLGRYKYVRFDFINTMQESGTHWANRPIIPNQLADQNSMWITGE
jgi:hypothetical protein